METYLAREEESVPVSTSATPETFPSPLLPRRLALPDFPWDSLASYKERASAVPGGIVDLSVGTPVDPTPAVLQDALRRAADRLGAGHVGRGNGDSAEGDDAGTLARELFPDADADGDADADADTLGAAVALTLGSDVAPMPRSVASSRLSSATWAPRASAASRRWFVSWLAALIATTR